MQNSFEATYEKAQGPDGSTTFMFKQQRFFPQAAAATWLLLSVFVFGPVSCVGSHAVAGRNNEELKVVLMIFFAVLLSAIFWFFTKGKPAAITVHPNSGIEFDGHSLPFDDIQLLGISTKSNSKKTWGFVYAESRGREISVTTWMDEAQARALSNEIKAISGRQWGKQ